MKKIKISLAALALTLSIGAAFATDSKAPNDCSLTVGGEQRLDSSEQGDCPGEDVFCCYLHGQANQIILKEEEM